MSLKEIKIVKPPKKVTNATEKLKIVQQKFSSMKITPSKFKTFFFVDAAKKWGIALKIRREINYYYTFYFKKYLLNIFLLSLVILATLLKYYT